MNKTFYSLPGRNFEIIESVMNSPEVVSLPELEFKLRLCVEEVVENIVSYAYPEGDGWMEVSVIKDPQKISLSFRDGGVAFNPLAKPDPDVSLSAEDRPIGGLGIFLCKQMMDNLSYDRVDGNNIFVMTKNL